MKIALIGYGKMGVEIERLAIERGHDIIYKAGRIDVEKLTARVLKNIDVAIEFTVPSAAVKNILLCFEARVPVVVGTTGWYSEFESVKNACESGGHSLFHATNFSIGVNIFFKLNEQLARLMAPHESYKAGIEEIHHVHKKDHPSGTGITLAEGIIRNMPGMTNWKAFLGNETIKEVTSELPIRSIREDEVPGTHTVTYKSEIDTIQIKHEAYNRKGFAMGAILAAEYIKDKKGIYTMEDLL